MLWRRLLHSDRTCWDDSLPVEVILDTLDRGDDACTAIDFIFEEMSRSETSNVEFFTTLQPD